MPYLKYDDGHEVRSGELTAALKAFNSRMHREGSYELYHKTWSDLAKDGLDTKEAKIQASKVYKPARYDDVDPQEWPLWGIRCEQGTEIIRRRERKRALLEGEKAPAQPELLTLKTKEEEEQQILRLALAVGPNKRCGAKEAIEWAVSYVLISAFSIEPDEVPGQLALVLLSLARRDPKFQSTTIQNYLDKAMPSKSQVEFDQKFMDDGREKLDMLDRFMLLEGETANSESEERNEPR